MNENLVFWARILKLTTNPSLIDTIGFKMFPNCLRFESFSSADGDRMTVGLKRSDEKYLMITNRCQIMDLKLFVLACLLPMEKPDLFMLESAGSTIRVFLLLSPMAEGL